MQIIPIPKGSRFRDLTGQTFGRWTVLGYAGKSGYNTRWLCECVCGNRGVAFSGGLTSGQSRSCGCLVKDTRHSIHGRSKTPTYNTWNAMKQRCHNPSDPSYDRYGGRGITVCARWLNDIEAFVEDMGERPGMEYQLDRIDNEKGYCKENCRWATVLEQQHNRRNSLTYVIDGATLNLAAIAKKYGIGYQALYHRIRYQKLSIEEAIKR